MELFVVIVLSIISILFLLVGTVIVFSTKNNKDVMTFSVSLGFVVLILLGVVHLIPESIEFFSEVFSKSKSILFTISVSFGGFLIISVIDLFSGHHHEVHEEKNNSHFKHISIITCIFLIIHNFIEGLSLYSSALISLETACVLTLGIGLHNIPLGFTLSSTYNKSHTKIQTLLYIICIGLSYLVGAVVAYKFSNLFIDPRVLGTCLSFTFGMVLYIAIFEFLPLIKESGNKKIRNIAFLSGIILMILTVIL